MNLTIVTHLVRRRLQRNAERAALLERRRLARDLHDGLGQDLYATNLALAALKHRVPSDVRPHIDRLIDRQEAMIQSARRLVDERADPSDGTEPLDELVERLTGLVVSGLGGDPMVEIAPDVPEEVPRTLAHHAGFALREMISNAVRHSGASMIVAMIDVDSDVIELTVTDDGVGHGGDLVTGHGLTNLRDRARQCGGRFTWRSTPGVGTTARWWAPLRCEPTSPLASLLGSAR